MRGLIEKVSQGFAGRVMYSECTQLRVQFTRRLASSNTINGVSVGKAIGRNCVCFPRKI